MKKVLVSGYIGFDNFGDEAIFYTLQNHLKLSGYSVSALCANKDKVKQRYNVDTYYYKNPPDILFAIINCDILISGGGSLLQNKTSNFSLYYYLFIILTAKLFFKKVVIFSQGIEPIKGKFHTFITKNVLKITDYIMVRDKNSKKLLDGWKINSDLNVDAVYSLLKDMKVSQNKKGLIIQLREFSGMNNVLISNLAKAVSKYNNEEISVLALQKDIDEKICLKFIEEMKKYNIIVKYLQNNSIEGTIDILNNAKYLISARLHALIAGSISECNLFALCYDDKIKTLCSEQNIENIDILNYTAEELDKKLDSFFNHQIHEVHPKKEFVWDKFDSVLENFRRKL